MFLRKWREFRAEQKRKEWLFDLLMRRFANELFPLMEVHSRSELQKQFPLVQFENGQEVQYFKPDALQALKIRNDIIHGGIFFTTDEKQELLYAHPTPDGLHTFQPLTANKLDAVSLREVLTQVSAQIKELEVFRDATLRALAAAPKRWPRWMMLHDRFDNSYKHLARHNR